MPANFDMDPELERELADALGDASLEAMMDDVGVPAGKPSATDDGGNQGESRTRMGTIAAIRKDEVLVEFSAKEQGVCSLNHFKQPPAIGSQEEFIVLSVIKGEGLLELARPGGAAKANWDTLQLGLVIEAMVTGQNKGGLELEISGHRAFMPVSQIDLGRVEDMQPFVNTKIRCQVVELDKLRGRIVLSRRAVLQLEAEENSRRLFETLEPGQEQQGTVRRIEKFGAFVEIAPGVDGLLHVSDMAWARVRDPKEVVQVGQVVTVQVLAVDAESRRISLGLKQVSDDPWQNVEAKYPVNSEVTGRVTRTMNFGAFVELEPGVEGLVHISQLGEGRVSRVEDVVKPEQQVIARVTSVDRSGRRIGLSIRAMNEKQQAAENEASQQELQQYVKKAGQARAMESLMARFGNEDGLKGGIG